MEDERYDKLKLNNQLCFPLYACSKEVVRRYKPYLDGIDLTYTQYLAMMVLWESQAVTVKEMGELLFLDSGTLTPVLKKLEGKGYLTRERSREDERNLVVAITPTGMKLRDVAVEIPQKMGCCLDLTQEEIKQLYQLLYKVLGNLEENKEN